jgi:TatD DNase family protein
VNAAGGVAASVRDAPGLRWIDNHCHLDPETAEAQVRDAARAGVVACITVGTNLVHSLEAIEVASRFATVYATAGVHPHDASEGIDGIEALLSHPKVVAVGEAGFDFHYDHSPREQQREVFARQVALAHRHDLPLVIHTREAWEETFAVLDTEGVPSRTVFHCFTGGPAEAEACVARGAYLSISGIVTFPSAHDVRAAVAATPLDRLLVETDSPFLAPVPYRGKANQPAHVSVIGAAVALQKGVELTTVSSRTLMSTMQFYGISLP